VGWLAQTALRLWSGFLFTLPLPSFLSLRGYGLPSLCSLLLFALSAFEGQSNQNQFLFVYVLFPPPPPPPFVDWSPHSPLSLCLTSDTRLCGTTRRRFKIETRDHGSLRNGGATSNRLFLLSFLVRAGFVIFPPFIRDAACMLRCRIVGTAA